MKFNVRLFAAFRERAGTGSISVELPDGSTVGDLMREIAVVTPALAPMMTSGRPVVNQEFAPETQILKPTDELALLPPVSGGSEIAPLPGGPARHKERIR